MNKVILSASENVGCRILSDFFLVVHIIPNGHENEIKTLVTICSWLICICTVLYPKTMDRKCAPDKLLEVIHCNCKTGCTTMRCSCKKNGLVCTYVCGPCQIDGCCNVNSIQESVVDDVCEQ